MHVEIAVMVIFVTFFPRDRDHHHRREYFSSAAVSHLLAAQSLPVSLLVIYLPVLHERFHLRANPND